MNRRNVLIGLGAITAGGGALVSTGAFSQVEAERTVNIETSGDSSAQVQLTLDSALDVGGDTIEFEETDINADAVTTYSDGLSVSIPGSAPNRTYTLEIADGNTNDLLRGSVDKTSNGNELQLVDSSVNTGTTPNSVSLDNSGGGGDSVGLDVVVNTIDTTSGGTSLGVSTIDITVE